MKFNTVSIIAGFIVLFSVQFYLFRLERINDSVIIDRYNSSARVITDLISKQLESDRVKLLDAEIIRLGADLKKLKEENSRIVSKETEISHLNDDLNKLKEDCTFLSNLTNLQDKKLKYQENIIAENDKYNALKSGNGIKEIRILSSLVDCLKENSKTVWINGTEYTVEDILNKLQKQNHTVKVYLFDEKAPE